MLGTRQIWILPSSTRKRALLDGSFNCVFSNSFWCRKKPMDSFNLKVGEISECRFKSFWGLARVGDQPCPTRLTCSMSMSVLSALNLEMSIPRVFFAENQQVWARPIHNSGKRAGLCWWFKVRGEAFKLIHVESKFGPTRDWLKAASKFRLLLLSDRFVFSFKIARF